MASSCLMAASNPREEDDDDDVDDELRSEWHKHHEMAKAPHCLGRYDRSDFLFEAKKDVCFGDRSGIARFWLLSA